MLLIQRYLFRQLLGPTVLATLALSGVALVSQSLSTLGVLVDQRQGPLMFAKITLLAMPQLIILILPIAVLVAAVVALNRLHTEQEFVICFAGGMNRWAVMAPAIRLSLLVAMVSLALGLWVQPLCYRSLRHAVEKARADLAATMVKPGRFTHPAPGLTVYAQSIDDDGGIHNLFIDHDNGAGHDVTITAREGRLEHRGGAPMLVLRRGANQEFSATGSLNYLAFDEYIFDLRPMMALDPTVRYKLSDRYPHELFFPDRRETWASANLGKLRAEGHSRLAAPLYNIAFMSMALAAVIGGSFSRVGYGGRIATVSAAAVVVRTLGFALQAAAGSRPDLNVLQYILPLAATAAGLAIVFAGPVGGRRDRSGPRPAAAAQVLRA